MFDPNNPVGLNMARLRSTPSRKVLGAPTIAQSWRRNCQLVIPFFAFPEGVRRINYTTNAVEALNSKLRRRSDQRTFSF